MILQNLLKNITDRSAKKKQKSSALVNISENNFYTIDQFKQRLCLEKRRSERLNSESSLIIYKLKNPDNGTIDYLKFDIESLLKIICSTISETDGVCLYKENNILVLLPDTDSIHAEKVNSNLINQFMKLGEGDGQFRLLTLKDIETEIISFPEKQDEEEPPTETPTTPPRAKSSPSQSIFLSNFLFKANPANGGRANTFSYPKGSLYVRSADGPCISYPVIDTLLPDQEMLSDFSLLFRKGFKRFFDIVCSLILLILLTPLLIIVAILIKLTTPGPVLYKQIRIGYKGRRFKFLKFRSMYIDSEDKVHQAYMEKLIKGKTEEINNGTKNDPLFKMKNDPRITPIGRFIRKTSIDELPQLWNVLKGEMSLVGPRPPIPYEVKCYENWHYRRILEVKPGVTGLWQVTGRNKTTFNEMVRLDIKYLENWSLLLDFKILLKTVYAVFHAEGG